MNNLYAASFLNSLTGVTTATDPTCPIGTKIQVGSGELGIPLLDALTTTNRQFAITLMYVRFLETVAAAGYPCAMKVDGTYGCGSVFATYAAAGVYSMVGISVAAVVAAGDYGWVQCGGLNAWAFTYAATAVAIGDVAYWTATNELTPAATDANRAKKLGVAHKVYGSGGVAGIGALIIAPNGISA